MEATNTIKATVINLRQSIPQRGGSRWLMASEKAISQALAGNRPDLIAGGAQSLAGVAATVTPFGKKAASVTGAAQLVKILGNTFVWNNISGILGSAPAGVPVGTVDYDGQSDTITYGCTIPSAGYAFVTEPGEKSLVPGHKYISSAIYELLEGTISACWSKPDNNALQTSMVWGGKGRYYSMCTATTGTSKPLWGITGEVATAAKVKISKRVTIDLTKAFGAGNEPNTVEDFIAALTLLDRIYATNAGELRSNDAAALQTAAGILPLDLTGITGIPEGGTEDDREVVFPKGLRGRGADRDSIEGGDAVVVWGQRSYEAGDESDAAVITDGTNTIYKLDEAVTYTDLLNADGTPFMLPQNFAQVAGDDIVVVQPEGATAPSAPFAGDIAEPQEVINATTLTNLLDALKTAGVITAYTMTWDAAAGAYTFTIS